MVIKLTEGADLTEVLHITKYEAPIPAQLAGSVRGGFPGQVPKTYEERIQNLVQAFEDWKEQKLEFVVTEKLDGSSATFILLDDDFHVCSRNLDLKEYDDNLGERTTVSKNSMWKFARENNVEEGLKKYCQDHNIKSIAIQGELIGEGIQENKYKLKGQTVRFFNGFFIDKQRYMTHDELQELLRECNLVSVPVIHESFFLDNMTIQTLLDFANGLSVLNEKQRREGLVFKTKNIQPKDFGKVSFKVISNEFLLKSEK